MSRIKRSKSIIKLFWESQVRISTFSRIKFGRAWKCPNLPTQTWWHLILRAGLEPSTWQACKSCASARWPRRRLAECPTSDASQRFRRAASPTRSRPWCSWRGHPSRNCPRRKVDTRSNREQASNNVAVIFQTLGAVVTFFLEKEVLRCLSLKLLASKMKNILT